MLRGTSVKGQKKRGPNKYLHIVQDARLLGVSRGHLWQVLSGRRQSRHLLARYQALKQQEAA